MLQKYIFIFNIFLSEKLFIFNQNILVFKNFYFQTDFFSYKKYIFIQSKKMRSMKFFYSMIFGTQIWSSIC